MTIFYKLNRVVKKYSVSGLPILMCTFTSGFGVLTNNTQMNTCQSRVSSRRHSRLGRYARMLNRHGWCCGLLVFTEQASQVYSPTSLCDENSAPHLLQHSVVVRCYFANLYWPMTESVYHTISSHLYILSSKGLFSYFYWLSFTVDFTLRNPQMCFSFLQFVFYLSRC